MNQTKQPAGLYLLFTVEMWERFSYYGMRAILILFLVSTVEQGGFGWDTTSASRLYGWYTSLVYLTPLIGGYLADRYLGTHRSLVVGGTIIALGHFSLALQSHATFYIGLFLIILGTGFFKPNVSTMVGQLYQEHDSRRDSGFTIFYMGINLGGLLGALVCGYLGESPNWGWHYGFGAAGVGMVIGLINYVAVKRRFLGTIGEEASAKRAVSTVNRETTHTKLTREEIERILALVIVCFFVIFFWAAFEQAGSSLNLFAKEKTARDLWGFEFPASWLQSANPACILLVGPFFAWLWVALAKRGWEPSTPAKMGIGLLWQSLGFGFMVIAALNTAGGALVSPFWLLMFYVCATLGEICLSPVGLSLVTKLAPVKFASLLMGTWFLSNAAANLAAGYLAGAVPGIEKGEYFTILGGQADFFLLFLVSTAVAGVVLLLLTPLLKKLMHGRG